MGRTRWTMAIATMAALGLALPPGAGARRHKPVRTCHPAHARTVAATARVRVFSIPRKVHGVHVTYGCLLRRDHPVKFSLSADVTVYGPIVVAGRFVAYGAGTDCGHLCSPYSVVLQDLRSGRTTLTSGSIIVGSVTDLVLRPTGSLAFGAPTVDSQQPVLTGGAQVVAVPHGQPPTILAHGPDVAPGSMALAGPTLYWTQAGLPRSAPLP
jgi:hypothetical protein